MGKCVQCQSDDSLERSSKFRAIGLFVLGCVVLLLTSLENIFFEYVPELKLLFKMSHTQVEVMSACFLFGTFFVLPFNLVYEQFGFYGSNFVGFTLAGSGLLLTGMAAMMPEIFQRMPYLVALFQFMVSHGRAHLYYLTVHVTTTVTPEKHRGKAMGFMMSLIVVGQMLFSEIYFAKFHSETKTSYFFFFGFCTTTFSTATYVIFYAMTNGCCCEINDDVTSLVEAIKANNCLARNDDVTLLDMSKRKSYSTFNSLRSMDTKAGCSKVLNKDANKTKTDFISDYENLWTESERDYARSNETRHMQSLSRRYHGNIKVFNKNLQESFKTCGQYECSRKRMNSAREDAQIDKKLPFKDDIKNEVNLDTLKCKASENNGEIQNDTRIVSDDAAIIEYTDSSSDISSQNNSRRKREPWLMPLLNGCTESGTSTDDNQNIKHNMSCDLNLPSSNLPPCQKSKACDVDKDMTKQKIDDKKTNREKSDFCEILSNRTFQLFLWPSATVIFSAFLFLNNIGLVLQSMKFQQHRNLMSLSNLLVTLICRIMAGGFYDFFEKDFNRILMLTTSSICNVLSYVLSAVWMDSPLVLLLAVLTNGVSMGVSLTTCLAHCGNILGFVNKGRVQAIVMTTVGVALFASSLLIGYIYDVIGEKETALNNTENICYGVECYQMTYMLFGVLNVMGTGLLCILLNTTLSKKSKDSGIEEEDISWLHELDPNQSSKPVDIVTSYSVERSYCRES